MAKKAGKFLAAAAVTGIAVAGISYYKKYKSFNKELDKDFHDFEENNEEEPVPDSTMNRNYVSLHADKDEFLVAAGDVFTAVKGAAGAAKNVMKDAAAIVTDTARDAMSAAADTAAAAKATLAKSAGEAEEEAEEMADMADEAMDTAEEIVDMAEKATDKIVKEAEETVSEAEEAMENTIATIITEDPEPDEK